MKFCKDCKWCLAPKVLVGAIVIEEQCLRPSGKFSMINGVEFPVGSCMNQRFGPEGDTGYCGKLAIYFEAKP